MASQEKLKVHLGCRGIEGNEKVGALANDAPYVNFVGPESVFGISKTFGFTKDWSIKQPYSFWKSVPKQQHSKLFAKEPSK